MPSILVGERCNQYKDKEVYNLDKVSRLTSMRRSTYTVEYNGELDAKVFVIYYQ